MEIEIKEQGGAQVVALEGEVDLQTSPKVREVLQDCLGKGAAIVVDLANVTYIDSSGVASLVETVQAARGKKIDFKLAAVSEASLRVLKLARLDSVFEICDTVDDCLK